MNHSTRSATGPRAQRSRQEPGLPDFPEASELATRCDQMARCYKMAMEEFVRAGLGWFVKTAHLEYQRPLVMGDVFLVRTWVETIGGSEVAVRFEILRKVGDRLKLSCNGWFDYTMVNSKTGRAELIPDWIIAKYSV